MAILPKTVCPPIEEISRECEAPAGPHEGRPSNPLAHGSAEASPSRKSPPVLSGVEVAMDDDATFVELIRQVRGGDEGAAAELVRQYEPEIRREVRMRLRLRDPRLRRVLDSMDIVQSVLHSFFVRAANGQYDLELPGQLRGLLVAMARNKLAEQVRMQKRARRDFRRVDDSPVDVATGPAPRDSPSAEVVLRDLLAQFRDRLGEDERRLADLRNEGLTWEAVAAAMGGTPEGRRKQLNRAVDRVALDLGLITPAPDP